MRILLLLLLLGTAATAHAAIVHIHFARLLDPAGSHEYELTCASTSPKSCHIEETLDGEQVATKNLGVKEAQAVASEFFTHSTQTTTRRTSSPRLLSWEVQSGQKHSQGELSERDLNRSTPTQDRLVAALYSLEVSLKSMVTR